eukprot:10780430-Alexandrium_andersonii.AAC.1
MGLIDGGPLAREVRWLGRGEADDLALGPDFSTPGLGPTANGSPAHVLGARGRHEGQGGRREGRRPTVALAWASPRLG